MKILFITHKYPPTIGGMEKQSYELVSRAGLKAEAIVHAYEGVDSKLGWFLRLKKEIKRILETHDDIDVIHLNDGLMAAACLWLKKHTDIPVIATIHGLDITFPSQIFQRRIVPRICELDGVICVSHATARACIERGFSEDKVHVVLNGVDHDLAEIPREDGFLRRIEREHGADFQGKSIVMTMGRAVKRKGFSWFLNEVLPHLDRDTVFVMVGPLNTEIGMGEKLIHRLPLGIRTKIQLMLGMATDVSAISSALQSPRLAGRVYHLGKVSFSDLMQMLAAADVFVMPNIKVDGDAEGFGLVALEASLRSTPVVAAGIEGIVDAVRDGKNGILLPSGDAGRWITTLNELTHDRDRLNRLSVSAVTSTLRDYSWDRMVEGYMAVFRKIAGSSI